MIKSQIKAELIDRSVKIKKEEPNSKEMD